MEVSPAKDNPFRRQTAPLFVQQWMDGGRRGPPGPPADRTASTIDAEAALAPRLATAGNTVQAGISLPPIAPEECALREKKIW